MAFDAKTIENSSVARFGEAADWIDRTQDGVRW
jgi:hypothetical protein